MIKGLTLALLGSVILTLSPTTAATAWTPRDVYTDFVRNGELTRDYTETELRAYLNDATLVQYGNRDITTRLRDVIIARLNHHTFPFTGLQLLIAGIVAAVSVGGGATLRLLSQRGENGMPPDSSTCSPSGEDTEWQQRSF